MEKKIISFKDLSIGLKIPIVLAWIFGSTYTFLFMYGFILGLTGG